MFDLKVKRLTDTAKLPTRANPTDSGMDLYCDEEVTVNSGERVLVSTGIAIQPPKGFLLSFTDDGRLYGLPYKTFYAELQIPFGFDIQFVDKSGLAVKNGITVLGGLIDESYRGELKVILLNTGEAPKFFDQGDKITQMGMRPVIYCGVEEVEELDQTARGEGGFGSTGVN